MMTLIILMYAIFSSSFVVSKILLTCTTPTFLAGARFFGGGIILLIYQRFIRKERFQFRWQHARLYAQLIISGIYLTYVLRFWALKSMSSAKMCLLYNLSPFMSSIYSYLLFKEKLTSKQWCGLAVGLAGSIPILMAGESTETAWRFAISWQEIVVLISIALHSYSWLAMRELVKQKSYAPLEVNGLAMTVGGCLSLLTAFITEGFFPVSNAPKFFGWLMLIIFSNNIICYNMYAHLLTRYSATFLSFAGFLSPLFGALYGWAFLHESITWHFALSNCMNFAGLTLFYQDELKQLSTHVSDRDRTI